MKKKTASEAEIRKLYDPSTFYEHGDNPAMKKFMEIAIENCQQGRLIDHRTYFKDRLQKLWYARDWDDFLQQDLKLITFPRALFGFTYMTGILALCIIAANFPLSFFFLIAMRYCRLHLPIGHHGITSFFQTQTYHLYGMVGVGTALSLPVLTGYLWCKTAKFTAKKFYHHVILGERNWIYEQMKLDGGAGEYYFNDTPISSDEAFPDLARGEMAKKSREKPEWAPE